MYSPPYNRIEDRRELLEFMRANSFALLVTATGGTPVASHLPVTVADGEAGIVIHSHMAKNNPQWQEFYEGENADEVLVAFAGPHAYVSPRWYEEQERVPTWNYAAVHAYGKVTVTTDRAVKHAAQRELVAQLDPQWLPKFEALRQAKGAVTDESSAVEQMGLKPRLVPGSRENLKVTWPEDLAIAHAILSRR